MSMFPATHQMSIPPSWSLAYSASAATSLGLLTLHASPCKTRDGRLRDSDEQVMKNDVHWTRKSCRLPGQKSHITLCCAE